MGKQSHLCIDDTNSLLDIGKSIISFNDDSSFPLLFKLTMSLATLGERCFKHKSINVIVAIKLSLSVDSIFFSKIGGHMSHLDVCISGFKLICFNLQWGNKYWPLKDLKFEVQLQSYRFFLFYHSKEIRMFEIQLTLDNQREDCMQMNYHT